MVGTPYYMSPEILRKKPYGNKSDVWSLGALLYNMLTGSYPFIGSNIQELTNNIHVGRYVIPSELNLSMECIDFIASCLREDPA